MKENNFLNVDSLVVLDSLNDGVYVVDTGRKIVFWGKAAERITKWKAEDILGKHCFDDILCHTDKDGHRLCGEEYCPLHRAMVTNQCSSTPIMVFARSKEGRRIPMEVSVAPVRNNNGKVIGGVETFRDLSQQYSDLQRVQMIQALSLQKQLPEDERISFSMYYIPHDIIGGDYYAISKLNSDQYGVLLADVTGHGVPAALYTMYLNLLWEENHHLITNPRLFAQEVNKKLCNLIMDDEPFASSVCGVIDLKRNELRLSGAGNPSPLLIHDDGEFERTDCRGLPFGYTENVAYNETTTKLCAGDRLLFFSDGAIEINNVNGRPLDIDGLMTILKKLGYPDSDVEFETIEEELLKYSDRIRFDDDLTFLEVRLS